MGKEIKTRKDDAESIVGESLAEEIEVNKTALDAEETILTVKATPPAEDEEETCTGKDGCTCKACKGKKKEPMKSDVVESPAEPVMVPEVVAKSGVDLAVDQLKSHMLEVKSLSREDALKALQSDFELVAKAVQDEFPEPAPVPQVTATIDPALAELLTSMKSTIQVLTEKVGGLSTEITILKSQGIVAQTPKTETSVPTPRNLQVERSVVPNMDIAAQKPMSIKELARRSVQA